MPKRGNRVKTTRITPSTKSTTPISVSSPSSPKKYANTGAAKIIRSYTPEDINSMNMEELKDNAKLIRIIYNSNRRRLIKSGLEDAPAIHHRDEEGEWTDRGPLSTKDLSTINDYRKFVAQGVKLLNQETGTVRGYKALIRKVDKRIPGYSSLKSEERRDFWDLYQKAKEDETSPFRTFDSGDAQRRIMKIFLEGGDEIDVREALTKEYERREAEEAARWAGVTNRIYEEDTDRIPF